MIATGQTILASDFISTSAGAGSVGKVPKLNASGLLDSSFIPVVSMKSTAGINSCPNGSNTQTITHGLGKIPKIIRIHCYSPNQYTGLSEGIYNDSGNFLLYRSPLSGGGVNTDSSHCITANNSGSSGDLFGAISNVTTTTFDIVWVTYGYNLSSSKYLWEAE